MERELEQHRPRRLRERVQAHGHLGDHREGSHRSGEELGHVETGHVLDDLAAAATDRAVGEHEAGPDDEISRRAEPGSQRSARRGGDDAADCRRITVRGIEHEPLPEPRGRRERLLEPRKRRAGANHADEVRGLVLDDPGDARRRQRDVAVPGREAPPELGAAPAGHDRQPIPRRRGEQRRDLRLISRRHHDARSHAADRVCGHRLPDVIGADDAGEHIQGSPGGDHHMRSASPASSAAWGRYTPGTSPHSRGVGSAFPGLQRSRGSNASRTRPITESDLGLNIAGM